VLDDSGILRPAGRPRPRDASSSGGCPPVMTRGNATGRDMIDLSTTF
jgi:hypothetical protein